MAQKCVHQGCGKMFTDTDTEEVCRYHPGPPIFHEGQKGWKCCKPRVLTFDEFLEIEPCTQGKHSTTDLPPQIEKKEAPETPLKEVSSTSNNDNSKSSSSGPALPRAPINPATPSGTPPPPPPPESDDDDPSLEIPEGRVCRRRACGASYSRKGAAAASSARSDDEKCVHHPGVPIFHEGSKGYSCCKRRVLEFDQFMNIEGCKTKPRHLFIGSGSKEKAKESGAEELLETVRTTHKILGTKLEVTLAKAEVSSWPVLRADDRLTGEILQVGRAGKVQ
ncbi:hypothetical protein VMCG_00989 [Cytospora schulzeri]|uniref:CHORD domain-containing protein n=1 Tax=Cytospora schulzeri TaxID=448051 RepID=A0A423X773_9PEZI|nr:hypothetical protein VMCG_00989 [Valsa malicola]